MAYPKGGKTANTPHPRQLHGTVAADIESDVSTEREFKRPVPQAHGYKSVEMVNVCDIEDFDHVVQDYIKHSSSSSGEFPIMSFPDPRCSVETCLPASRRVSPRKTRKRAFTIPKRWTGGDEVTEYHELPARRKVKKIAPFFHSTEHLSVPFFERRVNVMYGSVLTELTCLDLFSSKTEQFFLVNGVMKSLSDLHGEFHLLVECNRPFPMLHYIVKKEWKVITPFSVYSEWAPADKEFAKQWFSSHTYELSDTTFRLSRYPYEMYVSAIRFDEVELDVRVIGGSARARIDVDAGDDGQMEHFQLMLGNAPAFSQQDPKVFRHPYHTTSSIDVAASSMVFRPRPDWKGIVAPYTPANLKWLFGLKHRKLAILLSTVDVRSLHPLKMALVYCYARSYPERFLSVVSQSPFAADYLHGVFPNQSKWAAFNWSDFEDIALKTFNGHSKKYVLNKESVFTMLYSCGLCFSSAPHDWRMLEKELKDSSSLPKPKPDVGVPAPPLHPSALLRVRSQLNGANGEVTGLDDMTKGKGKGPAQPKKHGPQTLKQHQKAERRKNKKTQKKIIKHMQPRAEGRVTKSDKVYSQVIAGMDTRMVKASGKLIDIQLNGKSGQVLFDSRLSVPVLCAAQGENGNLTNEMRNYTQSNIKSMKLLVHLNRLMGADEEIVIMTLNNENYAQDLSALYELRQREPSVVCLKPSNFQANKRGVNQYMSTVSLNIVHSTRYIWGAHNKDIARLVIFVYQRANVVPLASAPPATTTAVANAEGLAAPAGKIMFLAEVELIEKSLPNQSSEFFEEPERGPLENQLAEPTSSAPYATNNQHSTIARSLMGPAELKAAINSEAALGIENSGTPVTPTVDIDGGDVTHETFGTIMTVMSGVEVVLTAIGAPELAAIVVGAELVVGVVDKLFGTPESANAKAIEVQQANNLSSNGTPQDVAGPRAFFSPSQDTQRPGTVVSKPSQSPYFTAWLSATNGLNGTLVTIGEALYNWGFFPLLWNAVNTGTDPSYLQDTEMLYDVFVRDTPAGVETLAASPLHLADGSTITSAGPYLGQPVLRRRGPQLSDTVPYLPVASVPQLGTAYPGRKFVIFIYDTLGDPNAVIVMPVVQDPATRLWSSLFSAGSTPTLSQVVKFFGCSYSTTPSSTSYSLHCEFTYRRISTILELQENIITANGLTAVASDHHTSSGERKNWSGLAATSLFFDLTAGVNFSALKAVPYFDKRFVQEKCLRVTSTLSPRLWNENDALYTALYEIRTDF